MTTQGDPLAMAIQSQPATPLLNLLILERKFTLTVAFADGATSGGKTKVLKKRWELISSYGLLFSYYPQPHSSWIVVKEAHRLSAERQFQDININITTADKQHLGAVIRYERN